MEKCSNLYFSGFHGMYNPYMINNMESSVIRLVKAIDEREKIVVLGNSNIDSVAGISLLVLVLKYLNADVEYYIPENTEEGISDEEIVSNLSLLGVKLIITVGCGVDFLPKLNFCSELGIDVILTDYRTYVNNFKNSNMLNPSSDKYPYKHLSASGIAYKLVQALYMYYGLRYVDKYIDLVMIGTLMSKLPVTDENSVIVEKGIEKMTDSEVSGIRALAMINNIKTPDSKKVYKMIKSISQEVDFYAKSNNARIVVELFTTNDYDRAFQIAKYLNKEMHIKKACIC